MESDPEVRAEEVIAKLKDDGDFDKLRLKIIRKLKENEDLRNSIVSMVKQSAALNRPGAENLKPRQLSDAIHEEMGEKVMGQISDRLWKVIRSSDGMKNEITDTVQSVYNKLVNPKKEVTEVSSPKNPSTVKKEAASSNGSPAIPSSEREVTSSDIEPEEPPGFSLCSHQGNNRWNECQDQSPKPMGHEQGHEEGKMEEPRHPHDDASELNDSGPSIPPGFAAYVDHDHHPCDGSDEDPDVPPGFG
ncbi:PREDICTED: uncharacterized protein LOC104602240 [Nelumbo nucifera]|uniref:Uncharacterized protein n=2 Tax=Nelumbo nucifera TaxID=4432 RepID=A0A822XFE1_NELNU|nr:PREDICTED: uncharacterized protein LOC104602240 [Nelumbo nucifera]DAD18622.1 TPA_asm: hypothetical protein HUJ06_020085 [Nelumbo nucifera]